MTTVWARFRTHEAAMRVYRMLEDQVSVEMPELDGQGARGYAWVMGISFTPGQRALVIGTVGRYDGVTFDSATITDQVVSE